MISALGLDLGHKRIGVAGCDRTGLLATGLTTLHRTSFAEDLRQLQEWVSERQAEVLVVGLPYRLNGELGNQAKRTQKLAHRIARALNLPLVFVDERLTSVEAEEMLRSQRLHPSQHKALVDRKAACLILQQWLDQRQISASNCQDLATQTHSEPLMQQ
ncbi:Holliday junction resolvase RuvX [Synechococcales cyanobacterium C]|uniref:Putative pre-16S rRNA nuclease n=1 Tax=Petrachloros mirabilis ULC683 TaxID=2781853 RepID=A0A8K2A9M1_9CYAN|nr:Holliday junction resolvase RuvX [Petrachloros mirabilis]NCJ08409.1 Holliday junction resolvase RuvX [Petrachloros mirabilis ULC683]